MPTNKSKRYFGETTLRKEKENGVIMEAKLAIFFTRSRGKSKVTRYSGSLSYEKPLINTFKQRQLFGPYTTIFEVVDKCLRFWETL